MGFKNQSSKVWQSVHVWSMITPKLGNFDNNQNSNVKLGNNGNDNN